MAASATRISSPRPTRRRATPIPGLPGEERTIRLRLKLIADAGIVGLPNAGKSTFLAAVSAAKPKIADYPFTTLHPQLGVVRIDEREFVLADLPGLIEDAHEGVGLGDRFLGHVERCRVLLHLVDGTGEHAGKDYKTVRHELEAYGHGLPTSRRSSRSARPTRSTPEQLKEQVARLKRAAKKTPLVLSAAAQHGVPEVLRALRQGDRRRPRGERRSGRSRGLASVTARQWPTPHVRHGPLQATRNRHVPKTPRLADFRRIVVKVGSSLLVDCRGRARATRTGSPRSPTTSRELHEDKRDILVVSSGAIALGRAVLKLPRGPLKLEDSQAAAAVGQIALARTWAEALGRHGIAAGQILLTLGDTEERRRYLNARSTIGKLLEWRSVPVINENDTVATNEIRYGDNDRLAARVATMASADLLVLLSDIDGLYDAPPQAGRERQSHSAGRAHHARDRGHGRRVRLGAVARRHDDQDRGRQDRDHRRHPHGDRVRPHRASAARDPRRRALHLVPDAGQSGHGAQEMDRGLARAEGHADDRCRRGRGAAPRQQPAAGRRRSGSRARSRAAMP